MSEPAARWRGVLADALLLLFVAGLGAKAAFGGAGMRDVDLADESAVVVGAADVPARGLPPVDWSPLYVLWNHGLIRAGAPLEDVPYTSWAGLAVLLPAAVYLLGRALGAGRAAAVVAGGFVPATTLIDIWPYPIHLTATILALGAALAVRLPRAPGAAVFGLTLLTATYARPEYLYALYLFAPLAIGAAIGAIFRRGAWRAVLGAVALFAVGSALLVWALGSPRAESGRPIIAFGQHYAYNRFLAGGRTDSPWHQWENYIRADFGDATTVGAALRNNPDAFLWHVGTNARRLPDTLFTVATPRVDLTRLHQPHLILNAPTRHPKSEALAKRIAALVLVCGLVGVVFGLRRWRRSDGEVEASKLLLGVLMLALVAAPGFAAMLLVFPRFHYAIPSVVFATALAAAGAKYLPRPQWARGPLAERVALGLVMVALAAFVPNRAHGWCVQARLKGQQIEPVPAPSRACVHTIRELDLRGRVIFLDFGGARAFYAGFDATRFVEPFAARPGEGFVSFVRRTDVGVVLFEPLLFLLPPFRDDPDARALFEGRESELFRVFPVEGYPHHRVAVRRDLLPPGR